MSQLLSTLGMAFAVTTLAIILMGTGWMITGKSKLRGGMCGRIPSKKNNNDAECNTQTGCGICGKGQETQEEDKQNFQE
ncbi:MAG TPA: hypothetical protein VIH61_01810 [Waddliaceae bacterium]